MKMKIKKYRILGFVLIFFLSACENKIKENENLIFSIKENGVSLIIPSNFKWTEGKKEWDLFKFKAFDSDLEIALKVNWNKDLKYFPDDRSLDIYFSSYRAINPDSNIYLEDFIKYPMVDGYNAYSFKAVDGNLFIQGIRFVCNNREYILELKAPVIMRESEPLKAAWSTVSKSFKVELLNDNNEYLKEIIPKEANDYYVKEILDYGEQLMSSKEEYVKNYPRAINEFRRALSIMEHLSEKPHYNRALRLISICKVLQRKAYDEHNLLFVKYVNLCEWDKAVREARIIIELLSDDKQNPWAQTARTQLKFVLKKAEALRGEG